VGGGGVGGRRAAVRGRGQRAGELNRVRGQRDALGPFAELRSSEESEPEIPRLGELRHRRGRDTAGASRNDDNRTWPERRRARATAGQRLDTHHATGAVRSDADFEGRSAIEELVEYLLSGRARILHVDRFERCTWPLTSGRLYDTRQSSQPRGRAGVSLETEVPPRRLNRDEEAIRRILVLRDEAGSLNRPHVHSQGAI